MKPTRMHYFYAYKCPAWIGIFLVPLLCVLIMASRLGPPPVISALGSDAKTYLSLLGLSWLFGWACVALLGPFILGPMFCYRAQLNGAPFQSGDLVEILVGPNRGRVVRVLASLDGRGKIKVDLEDQMSSIRKGIFWPGEYFEETQLLRVGDIEKPLAGEAPGVARP